MDVTKLSNDPSLKQTHNDGKAKQTGAAAKTESTKEAAKGSGVPLQSITNGSDPVKWSADAEIAAEGVEHAKAAPNTRAERVAQLKAQIASGTYKPDAHKIADKMIQGSLEEELLTRKS